MITTKKAFAIISVLFCACCVFVTGGHAGTYWVDDNGTQTTWEKCQNVSPMSGTSACTLATANSNASAGDTVYLRAGTYSISGDGINPKNSGSSGNRITFEAYNGEVVTFTDSKGTSMCMNLESGQDYITIKGITCKNFYHHLHIEGTSENYASYNEIDSCTFSDMYNEKDIDWRGSTIEDFATYNWIHDCTFEKYGYFGLNDDDGVVLELGWDSGLAKVQYNVIEDCTLKYGGHHVVGLQGYRNVLRNNYIQNNGWSTHNGIDYGCKVLYSVDEIPNGYHLIEGNRISFADQSSESQGEGEGFLLSSRGDIIRYNVFDNNNENAIFIHKHGRGNERADENHIYNNTFWYNGHDLFKPDETRYSHAILIWTSDRSGGATEHTDNVFKNNIFYDNANKGNRKKSIACDIYSQPYYPDHCEYANNWEGGVDGDPKFINISGVPDPDNPTQYDFTLHSNSGAIDGGTYLTKAKGAGSNSTTLKVDDAKYFQDGWGNGAGGGASVEADWIRVGTPSSPVQIRSINYDQNTITLSSPITWADNAYVWLHKKSDGAIVFNGSAPDQGAYESGDDTRAPYPPRNFEIIDIKK